MAPCGPGYRTSVLIRVPIGCLFEFLVKNWEFTKKKKIEWILKKLLGKFQIEGTERRIRCFKKNILLIPKEYSISISRIKYSRVFFKVFLKPVFFYSVAQAQWKHSLEIFVSIHVFNTQLVKITMGLLFCIGSLLSTCTWANTLKELASIHLDSPSNI